MPHTRSRARKTTPKRVLALPDLEHSKSAVLSSLTSRSGQRTYDHAIREFVAWYCSEPRLAFNRTVVLRYRIYLEQRQYAPATPEPGAGRGHPPREGRAAPWRPSRQLAHARAGSATAGTPGASHTARAAGPCDARHAHRLWLAPRQTAGAHAGVDPAAGSAITEGRVFRGINKAGRIWGDGMSPKVLWDVVREAAAHAGIEKLAPHDSAARARGCVTWRAAKREQIQFLLGHVSGHAVAVSQAPNSSGRVGCRR